MMSRVKNPIFFMCSSSSEFRLGRSRCDSARFDIDCRGRCPIPRSPRHPHSIVAQARPSPIQDLVKRYSKDAPLEVTGEVTGRRHAHKIRVLRVEKLRLISVVASPPQKQEHEPSYRRGKNIEPTHISLQPPPMLSEQIPSNRNHRDPQSRS